METVFMPWVAFLPAVGEPLLNERARLAGLLLEARELEARAAALRAAICAGRAELLARVGKNHCLLDIEQASTLAGERGQPFPSAFVSDPSLREALRALNGAASPLGVLNAFHEGRVIRQHNLFSTATAAERDETLHRVFDWWNYGAVPLLTCSQGEG